MCGIAGFFCKESSDKNAIQEVFRMSQKMAHRGPDGEGLIGIAVASVIPLYTIATPVDHRHAHWTYSPSSDHSLVHAGEFEGAMAHRRLSVLDLSARGHQPMSDSTGRYWISYNGEIYNFRALRSELEALGIRFTSETDTEVLLAAFIQWGESMLVRLDGMFAFSIFDAFERKLFCARDQTGVKPFLYADHPAYFSFASEEKAFFGISGFSSSVRPEAVFDFFVQGKFGHEEDGFFEGIKELPAGGVLTFDLLKKKVSIHSFRDVSPAPVRPERNPVEQFRNLFFGAVSARMQADVQVGACLSGGLDSSSIVAAISEVTQPNASIPLFTASFPGHPFDETSFAAELALRCRGEHHVIRPDSEGLLKDLDQLIYSQDVPLWSTSTYAQHSVMRGVKDAGVKVVLDGQGGDELLGGYHHYYYSHWRKLFSSAQFGSATREMRGASSYLPLWSYLSRSILQKEVLANLPSAAAIRLMRMYYPEMRWLKSDFLKSFHHRLGGGERFSDLSAHLDEDIYGWRLKGYLKCEDRAAMWHSVESRTPFADSPDLIRFCRSLEPAWKIRHGEAKHILRLAMKGKVPDSILNRKDKIGYATPNKSWIKAILPRAMDEIRMAGKEYIDFDKVEHELPEILSQENPHDTRIFKFISFGAWRRIFSV